MTNARVKKYFALSFAMFAVQIQVPSSDNKDAANDEDMMQWLNEIEDSERGALLHVPTVGSQLVFTKRSPTRSSTHSLRCAKYHPHDHDILTMLTQSCAGKKIRPGKASRKKTN